MAKWRMKKLPLAEWAALQEKFGELQLVLGAPPDFAMFCKSDAADELTEIYITGPNVAAVESLSPGGWEDSDKPSGEGVALLVGSGDPWEHFGIEPRRND